MTLSQTDRVLRVLQRAGDHGTCQSDWAGPDVVDGGAPITRLAARVGELKDRDYKIRSDERRNGMAVYVLVSSPVGVPA